MKNRFLKNMKQVFVPQTLRQKLSEGFIVAKFTTTALCPDHDATVEHTLWLHLVWMMFSPYRPTVHVMTPTMDALMVGDAPDRVVLQVLCVVFPKVQPFQVSCWVKGSFGVCVIFGLKFLAYRKSPLVLCFALLCCARQLRSMRLSSWPCAWYASVVLGPCNGLSQSSSFGLFVSIQSNSTTTTP